MASKKTENKAPNKAPNNVPHPQDDDIPEGFQMVAAEKLWYKPEPGSVLRGLFMGIDERQDTDDDGNPTVKRDALIHLTEPVSWTDSKGIDQDAAIGTPILVGVSSNLRVFSKLPVGCEVIIKWLSKVPIGKGRTTWNIRVFAAPPKRKYMALTSGTQGLALNAGPTEAPDGDDDIPF